jgi:hypothetical protein
VVESDSSSYSYSCLQKPQGSTYRCKNVTKFELSLTCLFSYCSQLAVISYIGCDHRWGAGPMALMLWLNLVI